jgi:hypothetical protein
MVAETAAFDAADAADLAADVDLPVNFWVAVADRSSSGPPLTSPVILAFLSRHANRE